MPAQHFLEAREAPPIGLRRRAIDAGPIIAKTVVGLYFGPERERAHRDRQAARSRLLRRRWQRFVMIFGTRSAGRAGVQAAASRIARGDSERIWPSASTAREGIGALGRPKKNERAGRRHWCGGFRGEHDIGQRLDGLEQRGLSRVASCQMPSA